MHIARRRPVRRASFRGEWGIMIGELVGTGLGALAIAAIAGLACGFLNTVASSGSAVSLPLLMMIGLDPISANATNRLPVLIGGVSASYSFHRSGNMPWD